VAGIGYTVRCEGFCRETEWFGIEVPQADHCIALQVNIDGDWPELYDSWRVNGYYTQTLRKTPDSVSNSSEANKSVASELLAGSKDERLSLATLASQITALGIVQMRCKALQNSFLLVVVVS
jgi:hypothetical protein